MIKCDSCKNAIICKAISYMHELSEIGITATINQCIHYEEAISFSNHNLTDRKRNDFQEKDFISVSDKIQSISGTTHENIPEVVVENGKCEYCGETAKLYKCCKCGALICADCVYDSIIDDNIYCPECNYYD